MNEAEIENMLLERAKQEEARLSKLSNSDLLTACKNKFDISMADASLLFFEICERYLIDKLSQENEEK